VATIKPNIVFFWDNFGWGELGGYGGGELRGAPTPRIDKLACEGLKLLNFNVEAQCTPSRSATLTGRHAIRSGTGTVPVTGGADGMTRRESPSLRHCPTPATRPACGASGTSGATPGSAARSTSGSTARSRTGRAPS
jgi:acetyl-CoA acetyltransferase